MQTVLFPSSPQLTRAAGLTPWTALCQPVVNRGFVSRHVSFPGMTERLGLAAPARGSDASGRSLPVLQISVDSCLARTREMVLRHAGFRVSTYDVSMALRAGLNTAGCVTLLCQSLDALEAAETSAHVHEHYDCPVLRTTQMPEEEFGHFEATLVAPVPPLDLVHEVLRLQLTAGDTSFDGYTS